MRTVYFIGMICSASSVYMDLREGRIAWAAFMFFCFIINTIAFVGEDSENN